MASLYFGLWMCNGVWIHNFCGVGLRGKVRYRGWKSQSTRIRQDCLRGAMWKIMSFYSDITLPHMEEMIEEATAAVSTEILENCEII